MAGTLRRFILCGHPRNGSTLLSLALRQHPEIIMFGELFNDEPEERRRAFRAGLMRSPAALKGDATGTAAAGYRETGKAATFLRDDVFCSRLTHRPGSAAGFKIFYEQARGSVPLATAWDYLRDETDIHVVHLRRRNLLAAYVSLRLALLTGDWARPVGSRSSARYTPVRSIRLDPQLCAEYFRTIHAQQEAAGVTFRNHPLLDLEYERDVCGRFVATVARVHEFIGVPPGGAEVLLERQSRLPLAKQIENYDELREHFANSPYAIYFG